MTLSFREHFQAHQAAVNQSIDALEAATNSAARALTGALSAGNKVLTFGNGGSSAEASHLAEELVGKFRKTRRPYPAISLSSDSATATCISNDFGYDALFERQIEAFVQPVDVAIALTTSGKSANVIRGLTAAKSRGAVTIALTGSRGLDGIDADHIIAVPSDDSALVQEVHLILIHLFCMAVDELG